MMTGLVFITGANGHIGSTLARLLVSRGRAVRAFVRAQSDQRGLAGLPIERCVGDMLDADSVRRAVDGVELIIHAAAPTVVRTPADTAAVIEGTRTLLAAAASSPSCKRIVYVSSTVTVGVTEDPHKALDESSRMRLTGTPYQEAKSIAEDVVMEAVHNQHLPIVIVNPSTIIGPGDYRPTPPNGLVVDFLRGAGGLRWLFTKNLKAAPVYFDGGFSLVDVEDVAKGILLAAERGRVGERYILAGDNITLKTFFGAIATQIGVSGPWIRLSRPILVALASCLTAIMKHPPLSRSLAKTMAGRYAFFSSQKAVNELGYCWRPYSEGIARAVDWFVQSELLPEPRCADLQKRLARRLPGH